jgi:hypothetical protein
MSIRKKLKFFQKVAMTMVFLMLYQLFYPTVASALTSGPTQPEVQGFEPAGTTQMVDLFSGDFTYNIPLFELPGPEGGYPFNLAYHSGTSMDSEASWVGLGWSLNPGSISRNMRGLPDDFDGDVVTIDQDMKPNTTIEGELGVESELFGLNIGNTPLSLGLSGKLMYNNYKGFGVSLNPSVGINIGSFNADLGLSFSQFDGVGLTAGVNVGLGQDGEDGSIGGGLSLKAARGVVNPNFQLTTAGSKFGQVYSQFVSGMLYSHADNAYTPPSDMAWASANVSLSGHLGLDLYGFDSGAEITGSFSTEWVSNKHEEINAFGYFNLENADDKDLKDFNREKDGPVYRLSPNLASPMLTSDVYSVVGQGIGGMYRAYRSDVGIIGDRKVVSNGGGGAFQGEADFGLAAVPWPIFVVPTFKAGFDANLNYRNTTSGTWNANENTALNFQGNNANADDYESYYFKAAGEISSESKSTYDGIGGDLPVKIDLDNPSTLKYGSQSAAISNNLLRSDRKPRQSSIQPISNKDLLDNAGNEILAEYDIGYYPTIGNFNTLNDLSIHAPVARDEEKEGHTAGITALQPNGMRYVYGLPVYNKEQSEYVFSVSPPSGACDPNVPLDIDNGEINYEIPNTNEFYKKTSIPAYVQTHLLTSILGTDYVDVTGDGPTDDDYGYWVKFNYVKTDDYQWRSPYYGANYIEGLKNSLKDDKGSFVYGEREQYYLATAETKTHIVEFSISPRKDARGAVAVFQDKQNNTVNPANGAASYRLDEIKLFSKLEKQNNPTNPTPIKKVKFDYGESDNVDYQLCKQVDNQEDPNKGKLTLKEVWFEYGNNTRGELSPYKFEYNTDSKYNYSLNRYDKWGAFKPHDGTPEGECNNQQFPYVRQFDHNNTSFETDIKEDISAWNLKKIDLPTGASIEIDYEPDDYGYEQNRVATQMFNVQSVANTSGSIFNKIISGEATNAVDRRVYFELEDRTTSTSKSVIDKYVEDLHIDEQGDKQMYYKFYMDLKNNGTYEFV